MEEAVEVDHLAEDSRQLLRDAVPVDAVALEVFEVIDAAARNVCVPFVLISDKDGTR
jgi:hypothetical protein